MDLLRLLSVGVNLRIIIIIIKLSILGHYILVQPPNDISPCGNVIPLWLAPIGYLGVLLIQPEP